MTRPYHPSDGGANPGKEPTVEEIRQRAAKIVEAMEDDELKHPGLRCPK
jgi:hypothetical protein